MKSFFNEHLRKITIFAWFIKVLALPFQLILAETTAKLMSSAIDGEVGIVVQLSVFLLIFVLGYKIVDTILKVLYEKKDGDRAARMQDEAVLVLSGQSYFQTLCFWAGRISGKTE